MAAGRKALVEALGAWESELLPTAGARERRVRRYLLTRLGPIRFLRWKTRKDNRYAFPLDVAMGPFFTSTHGMATDRATRGPAALRRVASLALERFELDRPVRLVGVRAEFER